MSRLRPFVLLLALAAAAPVRAGVPVRAAGPMDDAAAVPPAFEVETQVLYSRRDVAALRRLCVGATGEADLLCRYRLYPLTQDAALIARLPTAAPAPTARAHALLSGLWGYRAARASAFQLPALGRRTLDLLRAARRLDATDPFVLLVDGQSLLFRPAIAGGDAREALSRFRTLRLHARDGVSTTEADVWVWYALHRLRDAAADPLRRRLLGASPAPLYRDFLLHPPRG